MMLVIYLILFCYQLAEKDTLDIYMNGDKVNAVVSIIASHLRTKMIYCYTFCSSQSLWKVALRCISSWALIRHTSWHQAVGAREKEYCTHSLWRDNRFQRAWSRLNMANCAYTHSSRCHSLQYPHC